jgi:hypothetical protein
VLRLEERLPCIAGLGSFLVVVKVGKATRIARHTMGKKQKEKIKGEVPPTRAVRSARLVGTEIVLTGSRPEVAVALVGLEVDLHRVATFSVLQSGMAYALKRTSAEGAS